MNFFHFRWVSGDGNINSFEIHHGSENKMWMSSPMNQRHQDTCKRSPVSYHDVAWKSNLYLYGIKQWQVGERLLSISFLSWNKHLQLFVDSGSPSHCFNSLLTSDVPILLGMFWFCLNLSENLPSESTSKAPLEGERGASHRDVFEVFSNISLRAAVSDCLCCSW